MDSKKLALRIVGLAKDKKAEDPVILDMRKACSFCDYFVILSGTSLRHTKALSEAIAQDLEKERIKPLVQPASEENPWILVDFSNVVVHIFNKPTRQFYSLERLWQDAPRVHPAPARRSGARIPKKKNERKKR